MNYNQRKEEIIASSYRLFQENGYDNVSVLDICRACKITKPTFYKYIESKERLLVLYYDGTIDMGLDELQERENDDDYFEQSFRGISYSLERGVEFGHDLYSRYLQYLFDNHRPTARYGSPITPYIKQAIRRAQESGQIRNLTDPEELFIMARNLCLGIGCQWCFGPGDFDVFQELRRSYETLMQPDWDVISQCSTRHEISESEKPLPADA